jgi:hypothetical protein
LCYNELVVRNAAILERVIEPGEGDLAPDLAKYILKLNFPPKDHQRYALLSGKAQEGSLTPEEETELDDYLSVNAFLSIIQSKARASLRQRSGAA